MMISFTYSLLKFKALIPATIVCILFSLSVSSQGGYKAGKPDAKFYRTRAIDLLKSIRTAIKDNYFDKTFKGIDIDARFDAAIKKMEQQETNRDLFRTIASVVVEFDDSHTFFIPPDRATRVEYGFTMKVIGDGCFIVDVKKGSDAESRGVRRGQQVLSFNGFVPGRANLSKLLYIIYLIDPQPAVALQLLNPDSSEVNVTVTAQFVSDKERQTAKQKRTQEERDKPYFCNEISPATIACKLRTFDIDGFVVSKLMKEIGTHKNLLLDLRDNGGGLIDTALDLIGNFFEKDVLVAHEKRRDKIRDVVAKGSKSKAFKGEVVVLIDSESGSAAEIFARVMQLEKRATVVGDRSSGAVMASQIMFFLVPVVSVSSGGQAPAALAALSVTVADPTMADGKRLEGTGVAPDVAVSMSQVALSTGMDPMLSYGASIVGEKLSAEQAGKLYFLLAKPEADFDQDIQPSGR